MVLNSIIVGKDCGFGYGLLRLSNDFRWRLRNVWQFFTYGLLSLLFEWDFAYHEMAGERVFFGKKKENRNGYVNDEQLKKTFFGKAKRQLLLMYSMFNTTNL